MQILQPHFSQNPPLSLYIHFPWCIEKCPYCDFNSHKVSANFPEEQYINSLLEDLETDLPLIWGRPINTIFMGGGTPSLFSATAINRLLSGIRARLPLIANAEITLEANPGAVEAENFAGYCDAGVNRLSLGVQSFNPEHLKALGRIHDGEQAIRAFQMARKAGFERINLDLMHALPNQSVEQALHDLNIATSLKPEHISWYQLTIEPNTAFYSKPPVLADEEHNYQIFTAGIKQLHAQSYIRYEISAFSIKNEASKHNKNYWEFGDYVGLGAGAHSKITHVPSGNILRRQKMRQPKSYLNKDKPYLAAETAIKIEELPLEFMMNALRLCNGVTTEQFSAHTGLAPTLIDAAVEKAQKQGLMHHWPKRIEATAKGLQFLNDLLPFFFEDKLPQLHQAQIIPIRKL